jgi:hypothetical protein
MKTFLAQNQFISSASHVPVDVGSAAVTLSPPLQTAAEQTNYINEIFFYARKLIAEDNRFVLNEREFLDAIEETPLFLRAGSL